MEEDDDLLDIDDFPEIPEIEEMTRKKETEEKTIPEERNTESSIQMSALKQRDEKSRQQHQPKLMENNVEESHDGKDGTQSGEIKTLGKKIDGLHNSKSITTKANHEVKKGLESKLEGYSEDTGEPLGLFSEMKTDNNDQKIPEIYQTTPMNPDTVELTDMKKSDELRMLTEPQKIKTVYVDIETPGISSSSKRTMNEDDMEQSPDGNKDTTDPAMVGLDSQDDMEFGTVSTMEPLNKIDTNTADSSMVEPNGGRNIKYGTVSTMEPLNKIDTNTADSSMVEPNSRKNMKYGTSSTLAPLNKVNKDITDSSMGGVGNINSGASLSMQPLNENRKDTADPVMTNSMSMDNEDMNLSMEKMMENSKEKFKKKEKDRDKTVSPMNELPDQDIKETSGTTMAKPVNEESMDNTTPKGKSLDKDVKDMAKSEKKKRVGDDIKESTGDASVKTPQTDTKQSSDLMTKPMDKNIKTSESLLKTRPLNKNLDSTKISEPQKAKPLEKNDHGKTGSETEESTHDDFPEYPTPNEHVLKTTTKKETNENKAKQHGKSYFYFLYSRRRRSGYSRRRRSGYSRRRRSGYTRRRRSGYSRRRRSGNRPRVQNKFKPSQPDETRNIKQFLGRFNCNFHSNINQMALRPGCMDKIQLRIRKYNRAAFSYLVRKFSRNGKNKNNFQWPQDNLLVKTEL